MRHVENTSDRLVLAGGSPLFAPFFFGGLGLLALGLGLLVFAAASGGQAAGSPAGGEPSVTPAGLGVFLTTFGLFVASVPLLGRFPYRRQIIVNRGRQIVRRDRTLVRLRQDAYPLHSVVGVNVQEARHPDGDPYFTLALFLDSGEVVTLERFTDRAEAAAIVLSIRDYLDPVPAGPSPIPGHRRAEKVCEEAGSPAIFAARPVGLTPAAFDPPYDSVVGRVGWVERSEAHRSFAAEPVGLTPAAFDPPYDSVVGRVGWVERSEAHRSFAAEPVGLTPAAFDPPYDLFSQTL